MTLRDLRSIGSPIFVALVIVSSVSLSARLYKDSVEAQKAEAAAIMSSAVACVVHGDPTLIP
jgi:hypothetical protein